MRVWFVIFVRCFQVFSAEVEKEELDGPKDLGRRSKVSMIPCLSCFTLVEAIL